MIYELESISVPVERRAKTAAMEILVEPCLGGMERTIRMSWSGWCLPELRGVELAHLLSLQGWLITETGLLEIYCKTIALKTTYVLKNIFTVSAHKIKKTRKKDFCT